MGALVVSCASAPPVAPQTPNRAPAGLTTLSPQQVNEDVTLLLAVYREVHPGFDRFAADGTQRASAEAALRALEESGTDTLTLYGAVSRWLATLRCDHSKSEYPDAFATWRRSNPSHLPFRFITDGERLLLTVTAQVSGLSPGDEVYTVEGVPVPELIERVGAMVSVDGFTEHVIPRRFESNSDLMGSALDHYLPTLFGIRDTATVTVRRSGGELQRVTLPLIPFDGWKQLAPGDYRRDFGSSVHLEFPAPGVGLLRVDTFVNYRKPVDPAALYRTVNANLAGRGVTALIIDLRNNGGGSDDAQIELQRAVARTPFRPQRPGQWGTLDLERFSPHLTTWDPSALRPDRSKFRELPNRRFEEIPQANDPRFAMLSPSENAFAGDVILLLGPENASGVTHLASRLVDSGRAIVVGEATGGNAEGTHGGVLFFLTLPNSGIKTRVPAIRQFIGVDEFAPGMGIAPHYEVIPTLRERFSGRDPALEFALSLAVGSKPPLRP
ncbi:MAG: S41 family peptidase [Myxococcota bacterium]